MPRTWPKRIVVDLDGTLARSAWPAIGEPMPGAVDALTRLNAQGWHIIVSTARLYAEGMNGSGPKSEAELQATRDLIAQWLVSHGLAFCELDDGRRGKFSADWYIDDKAIRYSGRATEWLEIAESLNAG